MLQLEVGTVGKTRVRFCRAYCGLASVNLLLLTVLPISCLKDMTVFNSTETVSSGVQESSHSEAAATKDLLTV